MLNKILNKAPGGFNGCLQIKVKKIQLVRLEKPV